jgi:phosphoglycolate phosphatase-like HAD superfamily hydrolase
VRILVLDFDGLLCDALYESILSVWNGHYEKSLDKFGKAGLEAIPAQFITHFKLCRGYARHLGHFFVSLLDPRPLVRSQQEFERIYRSIPPDDIRRFTEKVSRYRNRVREEKRQVWLSYHHLYPGMADFLTSPFLPPIYIVTAKDADSVAAILAFAGVGHAIEYSHIFGEQQEKVRALQIIQQRENAEAADILFFDDSLPNVMEARRAGYNASWAIWGYNVLEHFVLAQAHDIPALNLGEFFQRILGDFCLGSL